MINMKGERTVFFILLIGIVFLSGCTSQTPTGKVTEVESTTTKQVIEESPEDVVKEYVFLLSYSSLEGDMSNIQKQLQFTTDYQEVFLTERYNYISKHNEISNTFLLKFNGICQKVHKIETCKDSNKNVLLHNRSIKIRHVEVTDEQNDTNHVKVVWDEVYNNLQNTTEITFHLKLADGKWLIYDNEKDSKLLSEQLDNIKKEYSESINEWEERLDKVLKRAQRLENDKCGYLIKADLTYTELQAEQKICYTGKYINYAKSTKEVSLCNEISDGAYLGVCYSTVAVELKDITICEKVENIEYEAKGYFESLSSRDVCYYVYNMNTYGKEQGATCNSINNTQFKEDCKGNYDRGY